MLSQDEILKSVANRTMSKLEALEQLKCLNDSTQKVETTKPDSLSAKREIPQLSSHIEELEKMIIYVIGEILHLDIEDIDTELSFKELGVDSISGLEIVRDINKIVDLNLDAVVLYDYSTVDDLAQHICEKIKTGNGLTEKEELIEEGKTGLDAIHKDGHYAQLRKQFIKEEIKYEHESYKVEEPRTEKEKIKIVDVKKKELSSNQEEFKSKQVVKESISHKNTRENNKKKIAIIGMSGRWPNARNAEEYWQNMKAGKDCIVEIPKQRWDIDKYYDDNPSVANKAQSKCFGMLDAVEEFDPLFFNISPIEAETMDPQQRVFLEEAWRALEDAGYSDKVMSKKKCGVFVGSTMGEYQKLIEKSDVTNEMDVFSGVSPSILPARISYFMNLLGPSMAIDTACSSSLVAIHEACQSIYTGDCEMALAGGVRLMITPDLHVQTSKAGMMSPTGRCRPFDQQADGIVLGEAVGVIVLKALNQALEDGDHIYGIVKSSGVSQDGKTNGITAPSARSQTNLELEVYEKGDINPEDITLVEAHGTGTKLGDPIEVKALKEAFGKYTDKRCYCALGSVKSNIGHTTMAAGISSVIKVLLALKYKQIPPLVHFKNLNNHINLEDSPFYINTELENWDVPDGKLRMAAISSFGFSGTNCHIVIEEA